VQRPGRGVEADPEQHEHVVADIDDGADMGDPASTQGQLNKQTHTQTNKQTEKQTNKHTHKQANKQTNKTDKQNRQTNKRTDRQASKQANKRTNTQTNQQTTKRTTNHTNKQTNKDKTPLPNHPSLPLQRLKASGLCPQRQLRDAAERHGREVDGNPDQREHGVDDPVQHEDGHGVSTMMCSGMGVT
jgi:hypothetical protein